MGVGGGVEAWDEVGEDCFEEGGLRGSVAGAGCEDEYADVVVGDDGEAGVVKSWKEGLVNRIWLLWKETFNIPKSPCFV